MSVPSRPLRSLWLTLCLQALAACATTSGQLAPDATETDSAAPADASQKTANEPLTAPLNADDNALSPPPADESSASSSASDENQESADLSEQEVAPAETVDAPSEEALLEERKASFQRALDLATTTWVQSEDLAQAVAQFRALVTKDPSVATAHYDLGVLQERQSDGSGAELSYVTCLTLDRTMTSAAMNLAKLYLRQGRASEGIQALSRLAKSGDPSAALHNALAFLHLETGALTDAIAEAKAALKISETDHVAMITLARAFDRQNKPELADLALSNASANAPDSPEIANVRGIFLRSRGKTQEAMGYFKEAASARRDFPEAHNNYGASLLAAKNYAEASEEFELALKYAPHFFEAKLNLAGALRGIGDFAGAKKLYLELLEIAPEAQKADVLFNLGVLHLDARNSGMELTEQLNEATDYLARSDALKKDPLIQEYLKEAKKAQAREVRRLKREADKKAKEEARQQQEALDALATKEAQVADATQESAQTDEAVPVPAESEVSQEHNQAIEESGSFSPVYDSEPASDDGTAQNSDEPPLTDALL